MKNSRCSFLRAILDVDPYNVLALVELGWAMKYEQDDYERAVELLEVACSRPDCGPEPFFWLAKVHFHDCARIEQAEERLEHCLEKYPSHVPSLSLLAGVYVDLGRFEEALSLAVRAHSLEPSWLIPLEYLDTIESQLGRTRESIQHAREALRIAEALHPCSDHDSYSYWESAVTGRWVSHTSMERIRLRAARKER